MINISRNHTHEKSLYDILVENAIQIDHYESDLYVRDTVNSRRLIGEFEDTTHHTLTKYRFRGDDGNVWWDIPFMYSPFWRKEK